MNRFLDTPVVDDRAASGARPALHPKYRPDIDGLRALAVLAVLGFHAFPEAVGGGFIGVDIFFVISGFLISSILFANFEQQSFTYAGFYSRRIRRIFPALAVVLAAVFVAGWFLLMPDEYAQLGKYMAAGAGFVSNLLSWHETGYFDNASDTKPLLHLWSLGVEEQFYILWPLLIGICWKYRFNFLLVTLLVAAVSFGVNIGTVAQHPEADFYSPLSRFWELMLGGALAYVMLHKPQYLPKFGNLAAWIGLLMIAAGLRFIREDDSFPGWWALLPTVGTFLLIAAPNTAWVNRYLLANPVMVGIGLISYPLYLWHMPLLVMARIVNFGTPTPLVKGLLLLASFLLATATYFWVEKPLRFRLRARWSVTGLIAVTAVTLLAGLICALSAGLPGRFSPELKPYLTYTYKFREDGRVGTCWLGKNDSPDSYAPECVDPPAAGKRLTFVWGDSHAALFYPGLKVVDAGRDRFADFARSACPPILGVTNHKWCDASNAFVATRVQALKPDTVILFAHWPAYIDIHTDDTQFWTELLGTIRQIRNWGVKDVIVVGPAPSWRNTLPKDLLRLAIFKHDYNVSTRTTWMLEPKVQTVDQLLAQRLHGLPGVTYFSAYDALCDDTGCITTLDGTANGLTTFDYGHLTRNGAIFLAQKFAQETGYPKVR